jgi:branched-chain amino acid transport system substrate-binding protein
VPLTGPPALLGVAHNLGVKMALAEVNAAGGIHGRKFRLISEDDGYVPTRTIQGVRKLVTADKVFALTSISGSAQGQAALPLVKQFGLPAINTVSFADEMHTPPNKNIFVIGTKHTMVTDQLSQALDTRNPKKKWAIVSQDDEYGELTREGFELAKKARNLNVVSAQIYKKGQVDFSSEMLKVKDGGAEVLYAGGVIGENVAMVKELDRLGLKLPVGVSYVARVPATLKLMGPPSENVYTMDYVVGEDSEKGKAFMAKAKQLLPEADLPKVNRFTFTGYAGTKVLLEAINQCGKALTWDCTIEKLDAMRNFDTGVLNSPVSFGPNQRLALPTLVLLKGNPTTLQFDPVR